MKGKCIFTSNEINQLRKLIELRIKAPSNEQKKYRDGMRSIGFYGGDDWGIRDLQIRDLENLIETNKIKIID